MSSAVARVGIGFDAHRFGGSGPVVLGGVLIESSIGIEAHSDGDVASHAIADALLGAAGLGDIGRHFPDSDPALAGISSLEILTRTAAMLGAARLGIENVDVTIIATEPRVSPYAMAMEAEIASALGIDASAVSVKATTTDGMGFTGRGEGIAAIAAAMVASAS